MTTATIDPLAAVLERLAPRQRAHDKIDREHWLRTRLTGITATEAKVLHVGSTRDKADVIKKKIEGDSFTGNRYTDWGSAREDYLLGLAGGRSYGWLVAAEGNDRHLATPDGLRLTWGGFAVVECKTSKHPISLGSPKFEDYGYLWQILWQMYCAGADEAFYVWEQHDDDWSRWDDRPRDNPEAWAEYGPRPVESRVEHIIMTPELQAELDRMIAAADRALKRLDKKVAELRAAQAAPVEGVPQTEEQAEAQTEVDRFTKLVETQARLYVQALDGEKEQKAKKEAALKAATDLAVGHWGDDIGEHIFPMWPGESEGENLRVGFTPSSKRPVQKPDEEAAQAANPELWAEREAARLAFEQVNDQWQAHAASHTVTVVQESKPMVRVTKQKGKE